MFKTLYWIFFCYFRLKYCWNYGLILYEVVFTDLLNIDFDPSLTPLQLGEILVLEKNLYASSSDTMFIRDKGGIVICHCLQAKSILSSDQWWILFENYVAYET